ncbi:CU044_5270 family protein [Streptomyces sp. CA-210063]|uniref:CU044_5270 family protein n=1 Tax=Streptomyces sp. CA-210063 TaxID=2801029 RepID=UPI00214C1A47|nr:CU044_5270 family protein [Streptomyces sp. CA-210063]UUU31663.1 CU044_5270 family protein [Streptomyces sp. CA-210063]
MNPVEREELARLLPSPGDPLLSDDRLARLEDHLRQEITGEATVRITGARTSTDGVPGARTAGARPSLTRRRFALVAMPLGVAAAVLATVIATGVVGRGPTVDEEAAGLLKRIATVATDGEPTPVRADQYLYIRTQGKTSDFQYTMEGEKIATPEYTYRRTDWISADGKRKGLARTTWLDGQPIPQGMPDEEIMKRLEKPTEDMTLSADPDNSFYHELRALPTDPDKLYDKVWADTSGQGPTHEWAALEHIETMLDGAQLLPDLNGALILVAAEIPGVRIVETAKDAVGREGIGLAFGEGDDRTVWVFDRESLKYLGSDSQALLEVGVVDKVGEKPETPETPETRATPETPATSAG